MKEKNIGFLFPAETTDKSKVHIFYMDAPCEESHFFDKLYHSLCGEIYHTLGIKSVNGSFDLLEDEAISKKIAQIMANDDHICPECINNLDLLFYLKKHQDADRISKIYEEICDAECEIIRIGKEKGGNHPALKELRQKVQLLQEEGKKLTKDDFEVHFAGKVSVFRRKLSK